MAGILRCLYLYVGPTYVCLFYVCQCDKTKTRDRIELKLHEHVMINYSAERQSSKAYWFSVQNVTTQCRVVSLISVIGCACPASVISFSLKAYKALYLTILLPLCTWQTVKMSKFSIYLFCLIGQLILIAIKMSLLKTSIFVIKQCNVCSIIRL